MKTIEIVINYELKQVIKWLRLNKLYNAMHGVTEENIHGIEVLQKKCVRILTFALPNSHISNRTFIHLKFLKEIFLNHIVFDIQCTTYLLKLSCETHRNLTVLN